jgi:hypothetical protein
LDSREAGNPWLGHVERQLDEDGRPGAVTALRPNPTVVAVDNILADVQA